jgi:stage III sporulation protein AC
MDIGLIFKVAGVGMLIAVSHQILSKSGRDEQAMLLSLCGIIIVLMLLIEELGALYDTIRTVFGL